MINTYRPPPLPSYAEHAMTTARYIQQQKEWFSRAFLQAVAAVAGYRVLWTGGTEDIDGVDATVRADGITVDFQLKATTVPNFNEDALLFDLDVPTYRKLSGLRTSPGYLLVITLPADLAHWIDHDERRMVLQHCGYWLDLTDAPETENESKIRLSLPRANTLTVEALVKIMHFARQRVMSP